MAQQYAKRLGVNPVAPIASPAVGTNWLTPAAANIKAPTVAS
jgi:hypothetical protein